MKVRNSPVLILITCSYDFAGRRVVKNVNIGSVKIKYVYDGDQIIAEYDYYDGSLLRKYVYGPGIDEPVCMITAGGTKYYYHFDGLGSVIALSNTSGGIVERYSYDVFGEPNRVSSVGNSYMFTGRQRDENGLYYYRARYYKPSIGRFMQPDPIQSEINIYTYCGNNPVNYVDPWGLWPKGTHNYLVDHAFPNLTPRERQILKDASAGVDSPYPGQLAQNAYQHAMSMSGENRDVAAEKWSKFLRDQQAKARASKCSNSKKALSDFGRGLHSLADSTSPSHRDSQPWQLGPLDIWRHHTAETFIGYDDYYNTINLMRQYYKTTFGKTAW
jgi:RHS repeat-associated protein